MGIADGEDNTDIYQNQIMDELELHQNKGRGGNPQLFLADFQRQTER